MVNRLASEKSPYLLQHANNPVDWYPWGEEAFALAREKDKLIFLSVGYSTCHWCHVMERESFENDTVAAVMNEHFVNIKVDREERPDVDRVYMTFVQALSGGGGWPMSIFMTPTLKPIFGGTYFPPEDYAMGRRPGFTSVLMSIASQWESDREKLLESGEKIIEVLQLATKAASSSAGEGELPVADSVSAKCFSQLLQSYDPELGGFSQAPKFPQAVNLNFLFRLYAQGRNGEGNDRAKQALKMCLRTLEMMSLGGINDHISKGFARYSTDAKWHVPHFEKMLYDQAQLTVSYSQAFQASKEKKYAKTTQDILEYVTRDLRHPLGGFFSAEDADSLPAVGVEHKKEGAFCVWTMKELKSNIPDEVLPNAKGKKLLDLFCKVFHVEEAGNVDPSGDPHGELKGQNVLTKIGTADIEEEILKEFGLKDEAELDALLERCRSVLLEFRLRRPRPQRDDKILTSWNGLMITGLCCAGAALQRPDYIDAASKAARFVKQHLYDSERKVLLRSVYASASDRDAVSQVDHPIDGFADDYAFFIRALLDLYEVSFRADCVEWAMELQKRQDDLFWDAESGGYFTSAAGDANIVLRLKEDQDGAEPSCNSVATSNLIRLSAFLDQPEFGKKAERIFKAYAERLGKYPVALPEMTSSLMMHNATPTQIIIACSGGREDWDEVTKEMVSVVHSNLLPDKVLILADGDKESVLYKHLKVLSDIPAGKTGRAYVCKNFTCSAPISKAEDLAKALNVLNAKN